MAFPSVRDFSTNADAVGTGTSFVCTLPNTIRQNDVIFCVVRCAVAGAFTFPTGWVELFDASTDAADDQMAAAWKRATGTEGGTNISITKGSGGRAAAIFYAIQDSADPYTLPPQLSTVATGTSTTPNATTCTPTGGAKDYLWCTFQGREGEATFPPTYPTNYSVSQQWADTASAGAVTTNVRVTAAIRTNNNAASEDAGAWTFSDSDDWTVYTIAFHPTPADPSPGVAYGAAGQPIRIVNRALAAAVCVATFVPVYEAPAAPAADAVTTIDSGQLWPTRVVQYTSIAGPVVVGPPLSWLARIPAPAQREPTIRSEHVAPMAMREAFAWRSAPPGLVTLTVDVRSEIVTPPRVEDEIAIGWLPEIAEPSRPVAVVRSTIVTPSSETATQDLTWAPPYSRPVQRIPFVPAYVADGPVAAVLPSAIDLPWLSPPPVRIVGAPARPSILASPIGLPSSLLPWIPTPVPPRAAPRLLASVGVVPVGLPPSALPWIHLPPTRRPVPGAPSIVVLPLREPTITPIPFTDNRLIRPRDLPREVIRAIPIQPLDAAGRSDLPWLYHPVQPLILATRPTRIERAGPPVVTAPTSSDLPWLMPPLALVRRLPQLPHVVALPSIATAGALGDLPWLYPGVPLIRAVWPTRIERAGPPVVTTTTASDLPWLMPALALVRRLPQLPCVLVLPSIATAGARSDLPWLYPGVPLVRGFWPTRDELAMPPTVPAALETLAFLPQAPTLVLGEWPIRSVRAEAIGISTRDLAWLTPPAFLQARIRRLDGARGVIGLPLRPEEIALPWMRPGLPLVLRPRDLVRGSVIVTPERLPTIDRAWLAPNLPRIRAEYPTRSIVVVPSITTAGARGDLPWLPSPVVLYRAERDLPSFVAQVLLDDYGPPLPDVIILVGPDVGIIQVRPDLWTGATILVRPDVGIILVLDDPPTRKG